MARMIAIDLGAYAVKVSVFQGSAQADELELEVSQRVPQDGTEPPNLADRLAALDLLLRAHAEVLQSAHLTALAWPSHQSSTHVIQLPFSDDEQIEQTLSFAVEAEVPFDLEDMVLGWRHGDVEGQVLASLVPRDALRAALEGLDARGLDPRRVLLDGDVLAAYAREPDRVIAVIDVGHEHTTVVVARDGKALVHRSVSVAGRTFVRTVQQALGCSWGEAEALLRGVEEDDGPAIDDEDTQATPMFTDEGPQTEATDPAFGRMPAKAREALDGAIGLLLAEVRTTLVQAEDELALEVEHVVLTGGASRLPELSGYLRQDLGVDVFPAVDVDGVPVKPSFAVSRALARRVTGDAPGMATELRRGEFAYRGGMDNARSVLVYGATLEAAFLLAMLAAFIYQYVQITNEQAEVDDRIVAEVANAAPEAASGLQASMAVTLLADLLYDAQTEADFLGSDADAPPTVDVLYRISQAFPPHPDVRVDVDILEVNPAAILIQGKTEGFAQVDLIGQSLTESGQFAGVEATARDRDTKGKLSFTVNINRQNIDDVGDTDVPFDEEG